MSDCHVSVYNLFCLLKATLNCQHAMLSFSDYQLLTYIKIKLFYLTDSPEVLNLTRQHLKKVDPAPGNLHYSTLLLDHNDITRLENVETYCSLTKVFSV